MTLPLIVALFLVRAWATIYWLSLRELEEHLLKADESSGLGFEGSIGVDRTDKRTLGDTVCTNVWYLGNCSQAGIVEATLCLCMGVICMSMHMSHTHKCILVCVHVRMRLKMRLERHTRVGL